MKKDLTTSSDQIQQKFKMILINNIYLSTIKVKIKQKTRRFVGNVKYQVCSMPVYFVKIAYAQQHLIMQINGKKYQQMIFPNMSK